MVQQKEATLHKSFLYCMNEEEVLSAMLFDESQNVQDGSFLYENTGTEKSL